MIEPLLEGFRLALQPEMLLITLTAVMGGLIIGALPGLTATMAVAVLLPLTFDLPPREGLIILVAIFISAVQGGSIPAVLINTPGTPAATATTFDGYPMSKKGLAGKAIGIAMIASFIGLLISWSLLVSIAPLIAQVALTFSTPEYFAIAVFGLTIISTLSTESPLKGIIAGLLGLLIATIGLDPIDGISRFTFGADVLLGGISYVPALIGLFAVAEIFWSVEEVGRVSPVAQKLKNILPNFDDIKKILGTAVRSGFIGSAIGSLPGAGADIAAFVGYGEAKRWSKRSEEFGTGRMEGVAGAEGANNAVCGSALIPLMTLGIPGDAVTAIILGAFIIRGLRPGPSLFSEHGDIAYTIFAGFLVASVMTLVIGLSLVKLFARILNISQKILLPIILALCLVGSYAIQNSEFDVYVTIFFGVLGYLFKKFGFQGSPVVLALILGPMAEYNFRLSLTASQGDYSIFVTRPICLAFLIVSLFSIVLPIWRNHQRKKKAKVELVGLAEP
jgi:putative tricarboxylic transport membrane protein